MKLKNILLVVKNLEKSVQFYHDLFGLDPIRKDDGNIILTEGLVLQDEKQWSAALKKSIVSTHNSCELYFEETDIESLCDRLEQLYPDILYVTKLDHLPGTRKCIRFYDPDGHLIEVGAPVSDI